MFNMEALLMLARDMVKVVEGAKAWNPSERSGAEQVTDTMVAKKEGHKH